MRIASWLAQAGQHARPAHAAGRDAGFAELPDVPPMQVAEARRDQHVERLSEHGLARPKEYRFGRVVEQHDALCVVDGDDRIHRRIEDIADPCFYPSQRLPRDAVLRALAVKQKKRRTARLPR